MKRCQICLTNYKTPYFVTPRITICGHCINLINNYNSPARPAYIEMERRLRQGIYTRAYNEHNNYTLENFDKIFKTALPRWINKHTKDSSNKQLIIKIIRAERRGLLRKKQPENKGYPDNWEQIASQIRKLDHFTCIKCKTTNTELHVHHIIRVNNYGTHRKQNLVTLCKHCHETEHGRTFNTVTPPHKTLQIDKKTNPIHTTQALQTQSPTNPDNTTQAKAEAKT